MLSRLLLSAGLALLPLLPGAVPAFADAPSLFVETVGARRMAEAPPRLARGETRKRTVRIDPGAVASRLLPRGADAAVNRVALSEALPPDITVRFFHDTAATFRRETVEATAEGGIVWMGDRTDGIGTLTLAVRDGRVTGMARLEDKRFRIGSTGSGTAVVAEIDLSRLPRHFHVPIRLEAPRPFDWTTFRARRPPVADALTVATIDLLVAYTPKAKQASRNFTAEMSVAVADANRAFRDSGIKAKLRVVGWHQLTGFVERPGSDTLGEAVVGARFATLRKKRDTVGADLVTVVENRGDYCGIGYTLDGRSVDAAYGYSVLSSDCVVGPVLAHEVGHNLGVKHDRYTEQFYGSGFNFGYTNLKARARDIMSYPDECLARFRQDCATPDVFSSPLVTYKGRPMGIAAGKPNAADGTRKIRSTAPLVTKFRRAKS